MNNRLLESLRNVELSTSRDVYSQIKSVLENGNGGLSNETINCREGTEEFWEVV